MAGEQPGFMYTEKIWVSLIPELIHRGGTASMKRLALLIATAALLGSASSPFDQRLYQDQQILHALNRLTFGPRPGDVEEVRRVGLAKWIKLQLHPEQIL